MDGLYLRAASLQHNLVQKCPHHWGQHRNMCATYQSKDMRKSCCCELYSVFTVLWQASWAPPAQTPQPGCTWHSFTLKGCSRCTSSHVQCKPDPAAKIIISLHWHCFGFSWGCSQMCCLGCSGLPSPAHPPGLRAGAMSAPVSHLPRWGQGLAQPTRPVNVVHV